MKHRGSRAVRPFAQCALSATGALDAYQGDVDVGAGVVDPGAFEVSPRIHFVALQVVRASTQAVPRTGEALVFLAAFGDAGGAITGDDGVDPPVGDRHRQR